MIDMTPEMAGGSYEQALKERYAEVRGRLRPVARNATYLPRPAVRVQQVRQQWPVAAAAPLPVATERLPEYHTIADRIIAEVADKHGLSVVEIKAVRRKIKIIDARYEAFYRISKETTMSLPMIGRKFGGYDHTTVLHGIRTYEARTFEGAVRKTTGKRPQVKREPVWGAGGWH